MLHLILTSSHNHSFDFSFDHNVNSLPPISAASPLTHLALHNFCQFRQRKRFW